MVCSVAGHQKDATVFCVDVQKLQAQAKTAHAHTNAPGGCVLSMALAFSSAFACQNERKVLL